MLITEAADAETGEKIAATIYLPECADPQKFGSAVTYFRRYALQSLFALQAEDDDANSATAAAAPAASGSKTPVRPAPVTKPAQPANATKPWNKPGAWQTTAKKEPKHEDVGTDDAENDLPSSN